MKVQRIFILVQKEGYSFINQATALSLGLSQIGVLNKVATCSDKFNPREILEFNADIVLGIGSWHSYKDFVATPQKIGVKAVPWIVSDDEITAFVNEYNQLKLILTTSQHCQKIFIRDGLNPEIIHILPEAVDPNFWKKISKSELNSFLKLISISNQNLDLPYFFDLNKIKQEKVPILFTTGGDATSKGAQEVIAALGKIDKEIPWLYLIKIWPSANSFNQSIQELNLAKKLGILKRIRYLAGEFSATFMRNLMNCCDIYVAPSRTEGFGLPLVEAQLCEKPVVTTKATATQEVVKENQTGLMVNYKIIDNQPRADIEELALALKRLLTNQKLREELGGKARSFAIDNFSPPVIASKLIQILEKKL